MKRSGITWNASTLDKWLTNHDAFIHGTSMMFPGLRSSRDREDVIAYLHAVSEGKAPTISSGDGRWDDGRAKGRSEARPTRGPGHKTQPLRRHLHGEHRRWQSRKGVGVQLAPEDRCQPPGAARGKPVIVGAGMRGDRSSVVFAKPSEISTVHRHGVPRREEMSVPIAVSGVAAVPAQSCRTRRAEHLSAFRTQTQRVRDHRRRT